MSFPTRFRSSSIAVAVTLLIAASALLAAESGPQMLVPGFVVREPPAFTL